jgi:hypothetical protein
MASEYGIVGAPHPMVFLYSVPTNFAQPVLLQWLDDLYRTIRATGV